MDWPRWWIERTPSGTYALVGAVPGGTPAWRVVGRFGTRQQARLAAGPEVTWRAPPQGWRRAVLEVSIRHHVPTRP